MIKHKKVTRIVLAGFMALCLFMGPLALSAKADQMTWEYNFYHVSNSIRATCSGYREIDANYYVYNDPTNKKYRMVIEVDFGTDAVTGSFTLGLSQLARGDVVLCQGCTMTSNLSSTSVSFSVNGVNYCKIEVYSASEQRGLTSFTGNWSRYESQELTSINQIKGYVDGIESSLNDIYNSVHAVEGYVDNVESLLTNIENYLSLSHFNISSDAYPMYFLGALDGYIDTSYNWVSTVEGIAPTLHITSQRTTYNQSFNVEIQPDQSLYMIYYSNYPSNQFYYLTSGNTRLDGTVTTLQSINGFRLFLVEFKNTVSSASIYPSLCNSFPTNRNNSFIPLYMGYHIPSDLADKYGLTIDNTYTQLLTSTNSGLTTINNTLNGLKSQTITNTDRIVTALQNLQNQVIVNQNSQTVIDMSTNTTNTINQQFQTINNVELNILDGIGTKFNNVTTAIDQSGVISGSVNNTGIGWANYYSGIVLDNLTIVKYPVYIILIGFVLLCLLG